MLLKTFQPARPQLSTWDPRAESAVAHAETDAGICHDGNALRLAGWRGYEVSLAPRLCECSSHNGILTVVYSVSLFCSEPGTKYEGIRTHRQTGQTCLFV